MRTVVLSTAVLFVFLLVVIRPAHAEWDDMICVDLKTAILEGKVDHGGSMEDLEGATFCEWPEPHLEDCTLAEGIIRYDSRFGAGKVLPDLQSVVDSGADTLCVEIVPPYYNAQSWMEIPGWDEHRAEFPDAAKKSYADSTMTENRDSILQFLRDNNAALKSHYAYHNTKSIQAAIPAGLLAALTDRDDVVNIDTYGKTLDIPWHIKNGYESKVVDLLRMEIAEGKQNCTFERVFDNCPPLERNADGKQTVYVLIALETERMWPDGRPNPFLQAKVDERSAELRAIHAERQQPLVDFMIQNNQTVIQQYLGANMIDAVITVDFLPKLEARDEILLIESNNNIGRGAGGSGSARNIDIPSSYSENNTGSGRSDGGISSQNQLDVIDQHNDHTYTSDWGMAYDMKKTTVKTQRVDSTRTTAMQEQIIQTRSPLQQIRDGAVPSDVQCREGLILTMLAGGKPACLTESTAQVLTKRGLVQ